MALIECKECHRKIHENADPCPQCGVKEPGVSPEEKVLRERIESLKEMKEHFAREISWRSRNVLGRFLYRKEIAGYIEQTDAYQREARKLETELSQLQERKWKSAREN
jgi:ubiquinone biosynthesis protein UbiJ